MIRIPEPPLRTIFFAAMVVAMALASANNAGPASARAALEMDAIGSLVSPPPRW